MGLRSLIYKPQAPVNFYGPFEKWVIDAISSLPCTNFKRDYIIFGVGYMKSQDTYISSIDKVNVFGYYVEHNINSLILQNFIKDHNNVDKA